MRAAKELSAIPIPIYVPLSRESFVTRVKAADAPEIIVPEVKPKTIA